MAKIFIEIFPKGKGDKRWHIEARNIANQKKLRQLGPMTSAEARQKAKVLRKRLVDRGNEVRIGRTT